MATSTWELASIPRLDGRFAAPRSERATARLGASGLGHAQRGEDDGEVRQREDGDRDGETARLQGCAGDRRQKESADLPDEHEQTERGAGSRGTDLVELGGHREKEGREGAAADRRDGKEGKDGGVRRDGEREERGPGDDRAEHEDRLAT